MASTRLTIPVVIEKVRPQAAPSYFAVRPVFFDGFEGNGAREEMALERLQQELRRTLTHVVKQPNHLGLAAQGFHPPLTRHHVHLQLRLRKRTYRGRFLLVAFPEFDRRLVFCPKLPEVCFEWRRGESVEERATDVLTEHFKEQEREEGEAQPETIASPHFARLGVVEIETSIKAQWQSSDGGPRRAELGGGEQVDGGEALERVGRCLDRLYPNRLQRAILREDLVKELLGLLQTKVDQSRPVLLVGPSQVGKTAVIHEVVHRRCQDSVSKRGQVWLLNPQRLISGMSFVGQWEGRFLAIMKHARNRGHVLYIDDLIGLFQAGKTQGSSLNAGTLLKAQLEESPIKVVAELSPEAWRRVREIDRGLAELFHVIQVREPSEAETTRILIRAMHRLEKEREHCRFAPDVLPKIMQLQRRYARSRSFPGKGVEFLQQLASAQAKEEETISAEQALTYFQSKTGLSALFLHETANYDRTTLRAFFDERIVGQATAVEAMMDAVALSKAQLNDPTRPLASLLFLGPTGVGKTECAKALAELAFGSSERLLRLDMNEFVGPDASLRLIGGAGAGQGILTAAVRRQPYTVILLDEVEKAHPDVFDLLLQVLGEGRLSDHQGQTADFTNALIILTSNLGARSSRVPLGFAPADRDSTSMYVEAAEKFFRPEFFNRLDRVVPFHELSREHIQGMVERLTRAALERFGFRQRKLALEVEPAVYAFLTEHGFDPQYGARALRRAIEDHLIQPIARSLAASESSAMATVQVIMEQGRPTLTQSTFEEAAPTSVWELGTVKPERALELMDGVRTFIQRADEALEKMDAGFDEDDYAGRANYYALREQLTWIRQQRERLIREVEVLMDPRLRTRPAMPPRLGKRATRLRLPLSKRAGLLGALSKVPHGETFFRQMVDEAEIQDPLSNQTESVVQAVNRLHVQLANLEQVDEARLQFSGNGLLIESVTSLAWRIAREKLEKMYLPWLDRYAATFSEAEWAPGDWQTQDLSAIKQPLEGFAWTAVAAQTLLKFEEGTHLFFDQDGAHHHIDCRTKDEAELAVIRVHHECGLSIDLRTGLIRDPFVRPLWECVDPHLPVAPELQPLLGD